MSNMSFNCSDSAEAVMVKVMGKLKTISDNGELRKIRIGGDEFIFVGDKDKVTDVIVNSKKIDELTDQEKKDMDDKRQTIVGNILPQPIAQLAVDDDSDGDVTAPVDTSVPLSSTIPPPSPVADLNATVRNAVTEKVNANEMFTAFDITKAVRQSGGRAYHSQVKGIVHGMFQNGEMTGYDRMVVDLPNSPGRPYLYYPPTADPSTYQG